MSLHGPINGYRCWPQGRDTCLRACAASGQFTREIGMVFIEVLYWMGLLCLCPIVIAAARDAIVAAARQSKPAGSAPPVKSAANQVP